MFISVSNEINRSHFSFQLFYHYMIRREQRSPLSKIYIVVLVGNPVFGTGGYMFIEQYNFVEALLYDGRTTAGNRRLSGKCTLSASRRVFHHPHPCSFGVFLPL